MKNQALFSSKDKTCRLLQFLFGAGFSAGRSGSQHIVKLPVLVKV